jgi:hypothetical protein
LRPGAGTQSARARGFVTTSDVVRGAVVLCGGRGARIGRDEATPPFGAETLPARLEQAGA